MYVKLEQDEGTGRLLYGDCEQLHVYLAFWRFRIELKVCDVVNS